MATYSYELTNANLQIRQVFNVIAKDRKTADIIMELNKHLFNKVMNGDTLLIN